MALLISSSVLVEEMKKDPTKTEEEINKAIDEAYINKVKLEAKKGLMYELDKFGIPCVGVSGWEFDDLAWLASCMLYSEGGKKSIIITKDSDLQYSLSPTMDYFRIPTGGSEPEIITYDQMYEKIPHSLRGRISLYQYKSFLDSLGEGHKFVGISVSFINNLNPFRLLLLIDPFIPLFKHSLKLLISFLFEINCLSNLFL